MAYDYTKLAQWSTFNVNAQTKGWYYTSSVDNLATVEASGYFNSALSNSSEDETDLIAVGDVISVYASNGNAMLAVTGVDPITTSEMSVSSNTLGLYTTVAITAAEFNGMYAAPKLLVAAPGAGKKIILKQLQLDMTYGAAAFAAGGVAAAQYDSTVHGAGIIASTTLSAATFQATASTTFTFNAGVVPLTASTTTNKGLYLSNLTAAFTTGDSDFVAHVWYSIISASA